MIVFSVFQRVFDHFTCRDKYTCIGRYLQHVCWRRVSAAGGISARTRALESGTPTIDTRDTCLSHRADGAYVFSSTYRRKLNRSHPLIHADKMSVWF